MLHAYEPGALELPKRPELLAKYDLSSLRHCISGGAALPLEVKQRFEELTGCTLVEGYGLTEAAPVCTIPGKPR